MIATFAIEIGLAVYTIWRYKLSTVTRLIVITLASLAVFQLAEYLVCQNIGDALLWSRVGFIAITVLPPAGLHLLHVLTQSKQRWIPWPGYLLGAGFVSFFLLSANSIVGNQCMGNYVIFQIGQHAGLPFSIYYYGLLGISLLLGWYHLRQKHPKRIRRSIAGLMIGYTIFLIPTTTAALANPEVMNAIPSIMCGFAVLLAVVLGLVVLPSAAKPKKRS